MPPAAPEDYVELRCRSAFSFLEAASNPEDLAIRAAELGHTALALADRDGLYGTAGGTTRTTANVLFSSRARHWRL